VKPPEFALAGFADVAFVHHLNIAHNERLAADLLALVELMRDEQNRHAVGVKLLHHRDQVLDLASCQRCGWLVHDHEPGFPGDRTRNRHQLAGCNRQFLDAAAQEMIVAGKTDLGQGVAGGFPQLPPFQGTEQAPIALHKLLGEANIFFNGEVRKKGKILVDRFDAGLKSADRIEIRARRAIDHQIAFACRLGPRQDLDQGGLAAAILTKQMVGLAAFNLEADAAQRMNAAIALVEISDLQKRCRSRAGRGRLRRGVELHLSSCVMLLRR